MCVCVLSEQRIAKVNELSSHLEQVITNKQRLISRLQQPFVNDYIPVELQYQRWKFLVVLDLLIVLCFIT